MEQTEVVVGPGQANLLGQADCGFSEAQDLTTQSRDVSTQGQVEPLNEGGVDLVSGTAQDSGDGLGRAKHDPLSDFHDPTLDPSLDHLG